MQLLKSLLIAQHQIASVDQIDFVAHLQYASTETPCLDVEKVVAIEEKSHEPSGNQGQFEVHKLITLQKADKQIVLVQFESIV